MNFEEQPVASQSLGESASRPVLTTCETCKFIASQVDGAVTALDAFEGALRARDRRIAELEQELADRAPPPAMTPSDPHRWHGADDIPPDPKPSTMNCPSCGVLIPGMRDALVELARRDSQLGQYDAAMTAARARIAALEAERDAQEALLGELRALIARPRGTWTQVVGETVIRSTDDKPPEQP